MPTEFRLAVSTLMDEPSVTSLLTASYSSLMASSYDDVVLNPALPLMTKANPTLLNSGTYYLALSKDGVIVGAGGWTKERPGSGVVLPGLAHIRHFATHPDWLGLGIGKAIYHRCKETARINGIIHFEYYSSLNAEKFYRTLGFHANQNVDLAMGQGISFPSILMKTSL